MFKRLVLLATILAGSLVLSVPANAQYEGLCGIIVDPTTIAPGGQLTVSGQGAPPGATLEMLFGTTVLASVSANNDPDGTFAFPPVTIPADTASGDYAITVRVENGDAFQCDGVDVLTGVVTVSARAASTAAATAGGSSGSGSSSLPATGSDSLPLAQLGALLVVFGGLAVLAARKRNSPVGV
jgi:LPXTG-motif cell wall-anchored protein